MIRHTIPGTATQTQAEAVQKFLELRDLEKAATELGMTRDNLRKHLKAAGLNAEMRGAIVFGSPFDITAGNTRMHNSGVPQLPLGDAPSADKPEPIRLDLAEKMRFERANDEMRRQLNEMTKRLVTAEDHRNSVLGLSIERAEPICMPQRQTMSAAERGRQCAVLHLSDTHVGEVVNLAETMGVNKFDLSIAEKRFARLFETAITLTTTAWPASDGAPSKVYILLGGDLISGHGLHPELAETDAGTAYEQCKHAARMIAAGALRWSMELKEHWGVDIEIDFISVVGNHGRSTPGKPRAKLASVQSYDTLVGDFIEAGLRGYEGFKFFTPRAFDAYFDAVGWPCLLTHGDRMSAGGGTGFIGPAANIVKGHKKVLLNEAQQRRPVRFVFSGHFHTRVITPWGFSNGSLIGYSEFAKSIRADAEPALQNFIVLHERHGLLREHPIVVGRPDEGSIYAPSCGMVLPGDIAA